MTGRFPQSSSKGVKCKSRFSTPANLPPPLPLSTPGITSIPASFPTLGLLHHILYSVDDQLGMWLIWHTFSGGQIRGGAVSAERGRRFRRIRAGSLAEEAYRVIRTSIIDGTLAPGERLVETRLAEELGVSRAPVREALKKLSE